MTKRTSVAGAIRAAIARKHEITVAGIDLTLAVPEPDVIDGLMKAVMENRPAEGADDKADAATVTNDLAAHAALACIENAGDLTHGEAKQLIAMSGGTVRSPLARLSMELTGITLSDEDADDNPT